MWILKANQNSDVANDCCVYYIDEVDDSQVLYTIVLSVLIDRYKATVGSFLLN